MKVLVMMAHRPHNVTGLIPYINHDVEWIIKHPNAMSLNIIPSRNMFVNYKRLKFIAVTFITIFRIRPDIIICGGPWIAYLCQIYARLSGCKLIVRTGADIDMEMETQLIMAIENSRGKLDRWLRILQQKQKYYVWRASLKQCSIYIVVSNLIKGKLHPEKTVVIPTPCDIKRYRVNRTIKTILTVTNGNFKGKIEALYEAIDVVNRLMTERDDFEYIIVGGGTLYDDFRDNVKKLYPEYYGGRLQIHSYTDRIELYYRIADISLYYSYHDVCPNAILESWASRTPLIINDNYWYSDVVPAGTAVIVKGAEELKAEIISMLDNPERYKRMVEDGYHHVNRFHSYEACGIQLAECLN